MASLDHERRHHLPASTALTTAIPDSDSPHNRQPPPQTAKDHRSATLLTAAVATSRCYLRGTSMWTTNAHHPATSAHQHVAALATE
jgi:hypothetical protein